jgi:tetratricopeptide (TPR) repeat protein
MDAQLGGLLEHERLADPGQVLVMVIADHGESLGEHGEANHGMLAYDATLRVPWIVRGPGVPPGRRLTAPVSQVDLLPTALELLGLGGARGELALAGASQAALLRGARAGDEGGAAPKRALYGETLVPFHSYGWAPLQVAWRGDWKLIRAPRPELFNLADDPAEKNDLAARQPRRVRDLDAELEKLARPGDRPAETVPADRELEDRLRSLGYLAAQAPAASDAPRPDPKEMIDVHRLMGVAGQLLARGELEPAAETLGEVLRRDPANPAAVADLARTLEGLGRFDEARALLAGALPRHPANPRLHRALASIEAAGGRLEEALAALDRALELEPASIETRVEKARYLARLGRADEAAAILAAALAEDPDHARLNVAHAQLVEAPAGRLEAAAARLRAVTRRDPYLAEGWAVLGQVLEQRELVDPALAAYREGQRYQPNDGLLQARAGLLLLRLGDVAAAEAHLRQAARLLMPTPAEVFGGLAAAAIERRDWPAVESAAKRALERDAERPEAWNYLAAAREEQDDDPGALAAYQRALAIDPAYTPALLNRGLALRRLGRFDEAEASFLAILAQRPDDPKAHYELGVLYGGPLADRDSARRHLRASLAADPDHPRAPRVRALLDRLEG